MVSPLGILSDYVRSKVTYLLSSWQVILGLLILCAPGSLPPPPYGRRRGGTIPTACCRQQEAEGEQGTGFHLAKGALYVVLCLLAVIKAGKTVLVMVVLTGGNRESESA